jgi:bacillithiol system protein YtxJ
MGWFSSNSAQSESSAFEWNNLNSIEQWEEIFQSAEKNLVFKHSTRCGISTAAKRAFEREWDKSTEIKLWYLDLLNHRDISARIADDTKVMHQSPQAILTQNNQVLYADSHSSISAEEIAKA